MEVVKKTKDFSIIKKRNSRFGVKNSNGKWINGDEKAKILSAEGLITIPVAKAKPEAEEPAAEAATEEPAAE